MIQFSDKHENDRIDELRVREAEDLAMYLAQKHSLPYIDLSTVSINTDALRLIDEKLARAANAAPFSFTGENVNVAVMSPDNSLVNDIISLLTKGRMKVQIYIASKASIARALSRYPEISTAYVTVSGQIDVSGEQIEKFAQEIKSYGDLTKMMTEASTEKSTTSALLELIVAGGLAADASDIHIEPEDGQARLRLRLDGILTNLAAISTHSYRLLASRIKLISNMKLNLRDLQQDGRFSIKVHGDSIEVRVSVIPGNYGESIVMRILNPESIRVGLEQLGMSKEMLETVRYELTKPHGMILNTGPTGSGKTTTLYSFLQEVNEPGIKIITIEDPIEYHLEGVVQTQVEKLKRANADEPAYTFNEGLKSSLRQDPDVIMVGEIRDEETAKTAVDAALTGHLVFSTLHTNDAFGAIPRLLDLGVNAKIIASALTLAMAQRLVRKIAEKHELVDPTTEERAIIEKHLKAISDRGLPVPTLGKLAKPIVGEGKGGSGYKGRIGIFEAIKMTEEIEKIVTTNPSEHDIKRAALDQNILTLAEDGIIKVVNQVTTLEELKRVVEL